MRYLPLAVLTACSMAAGMTHAATVTFEGRITDQTCNVTVSGSDSDVIVKLPTVHQSVFTAATPTAGLTPFAVAISGCNEAAAGENFKVVFKATSPEANGALKNTGNAQNVGVQLTQNEDGTAPLDLSDLTKSFITLTLPAGSKSATQQMAAQYIQVDSTQDVKAGQVKASVEYVLDYL